MLVARRSRQIFLNPVGVKCSFENFELPSHTASVHSPQGHFYPDSDCHQPNGHDIIRIMANTYTQIYIHIVFAVSGRVNFMLIFALLSHIFLELSYQNDTGSRII